MSTTHSPYRTAAAVLTLAAMLATHVAPIAAAGQAAQTPAAAAAPTRTPTPSATAGAATLSDAGWPRGYSTASGASLTLYQPQIATWAGQKHLVAYTAASYLARGADKPALGTLKVESDTSVAIDDRLVSLSEFKITEANFPTVKREELATVVKEITEAVPNDERVIALDLVLASMDTSQIIPRNVEGVKAEPPPIFFSKTAAVLVNVDGDPIWSPIAQNDLTSAVNTNWDLFQHGPTKTLYLRHGKVWLKASDIKGPWGPAGTLPASFAKLPGDENWTDVKASLPGAPLAAPQAPKVFVSTHPAELLLLTGEPIYLAVDGTNGLLWVSNTESDVFRVGRSGAVYMLVSGRWFSAPDFSGPWTFATPTLPAAFKQIPLEHQRSRVLASVPGTTQAAEAILLAQIPQTAKVKKNLQAPEVAYQGGAPQFQPIDTTTVQRAVNTDKDILKVGDLYYMCFQGVWFMSRTATGPWAVTGEVPKAIYAIPPSSPSHAVTYVTVVETHHDDVSFATAAAFGGVMVAWGCVVWGSGYYYPPYVYYGGRYPIYYPHYPTYGFGAVYNPWTGAYTRGAVAYGPYGGAGVAQRYNPRTGTYARGAMAWGPYGARGAAQAYNPRTGTYGQTRQGSNIYGSWGSTGVQRGDDWARTARYTNNVTGKTTRVTQGSGGGTAVTRRGNGSGSGIARTGSGDIYAGHDGNVYRKQGDSWQKYGDGGWGSVNQPTPHQVSRDSAARAEGAQRTRERSQMRGGGDSSRGGSYRASGGGARRGGGGGRRR